MSIEIRLLGIDDAAAFWNLRLEGLENDPRAFGSSADEHRAMPMQTIASRLTAIESGAFTVGAFVDGALVGTAGFFREDRAKTRHKGYIWGVYVTPAERGRGVAKRMLSTIIERLHTYADLDHIVLHVSSDQDAAKRLYASLGFTTFGHERRALKVDDDFVDQDEMVLWLDGRG